MKHKLLSMLGLCKKAGKLVQGFDAVKEAAAKGRLYLIATAADLSERSRKEIGSAAQKAKLTTIELLASMEEIGAATGKTTGILGIADAGFAQTIENLAGRAQEEDETI